MSSSGPATRKLEVLPFASDTSISRSLCDSVDDCLCPAMTYCSGAMKPYRECVVHLAMAQSKTSNCIGAPRIDCSLSMGTLLPFLRSTDYGRQVHMDLDSVTDAREVKPIRMVFEDQSSGEHTTWSNL